MRRFLVAGLVLIAFALAARPARAQLGGISLGVAAGIANPSGDVKDGFKSGYHIEGLAALSLPLVPIGFRGEVAYDRMAKQDSNTDPNITNLQLASGVVDATFSLPFPVFHPYAIGGFGYYVHNGGAGFGSREGKVGFNGGVGVELKLPVIRAFGEVRYHTISYSGARVAVIPVTVGITF